MVAAARLRPDSLLRGSPDPADLSLCAVLTLAVLPVRGLALGVIVAALLAGAAILSRTDVRRAWAMLGALVLAPLLLLDDVWHSCNWASFTAPLRPASWPGCAPVLGRCLRVAGPCWCHC